MTADEIARLRKLAEWGLDNAAFRCPVDPEMLLRLLDERDALIEYVEASEGVEIPEGASLAEMAELTRRWNAARGPLRALGLIGGES